MGQRPVLLPILILKMEYLQTTKLSSLFMKIRLHQNLRLNLTLQLKYLILQKHRQQMKMKLTPIQSL